MKKKYVYTYERTCKLCGETQKLAGRPRAEICSPCRAKKIGIRTGTGKPFRIDAYGYKTINVNKRAVYEHRYIMEKHLGRKLNPNEHVHHIDGNKLNNSIVNLEVLDASEHHRKHFTSEVAKRLSVLGHKARWNTKGK